MEKQIPSRRTVLRGALAIGAGLCLPISLFGCNSKKAAPPADAVPAGMAAAGPDPAAASAVKKVSQASVQYQTQPKGEQKCGTCVHFIAGPGTCKLVDGSISPDGWCVLWAKKA